MSKRESRDAETRVSPYLLQPARTYEEYLRDRAIADRLQKQFDVDQTVSVTAKTRNPSTKMPASAKIPTSAWKPKTVSADLP
jgi:hypothetical protein